MSSPERFGTRAPSPRIEKLDYSVAIQQWSYHQLLNPEGRFLGTLRDEEHVAPPGTPNALADKVYRDIAAPDARRASGACKKFSDLTKGIAKKSNTQFLSIAMNRKGM